MGMRQRFVDTTSQLMDEDDRVVVVLADISVAAFAAAQRRHPRRVINVGIREQLLVSVAGGLALEGLRPIAHSYAPFLVERPWEQIKLDLSHQGVAAVLVSIAGSYDAAREGRTHQSPGDIALFDTLPGWTVHVPGHDDEVEALLRDAARRDDPVYIRLSERENARAWRPAPGHRMHVVRRGARGTVVAVGPMLDRTLAAVDGLDVTVLYAPTVRPFDAATLLQSLAAPAVAMVEPYLEGTSAAAVSSSLAHVPYRLLSVGVSKAELRRYGSAEEHDRAHGLDASGIRERLTRFLDGAPRREPARV